MTKAKFAWALLDNRTGNRNQILGVLSKLNFRYRIIEVKYNFFSVFPNFFFQIFGSTIHINSIKSSILEPYPEVIISCGRRTATVSLALKKLLKGNPFCVHLMYPRFTLFKKNLNLIFTPSHDNVEQSQHIKKFLGSPTNIKLIKNIKHQFKSPIVYLIIGGNHSWYKLSDKEVEVLIDQIVKSLNNKGSLLITTSRRSSIRVVEKINVLFKTHSIIKEIYHPRKSKTNNTHFKNLSLADEIVVTGDSMSMVSEACETKKPTRIYFSKKFCSKKHIRFCENLIKDGFAFPFDTLGKKCKIIKTLNTSKKIALHIEKILNNE